MKEGLVGVIFIEPDSGSIKLQSTFQTISLVPQLYVEVYNNPGLRNTGMLKPVTPQNRERTDCKFILSIYPDPPYTIHVRLLWDQGWSPLRFIP